jgi:hypothetical protein
MANPPLYISLQLASYMRLDESDFGIIGCLIVDPYKPRIEIFPLEQRHAQTEEKIRAGVRDFWCAVDAGVEPKADFSRDLDLIKRLSGHEREGSVIDLRGNNRLPEVCARYLDTAAEIAKLKAVKDEVEAEIRAMAGDAEIALAQDYTITLRTIHRKAYSVAETNYRPLKIKAGGLI